MQWVPRLWYNLAGWCTVGKGPLHIENRVKFLTCFISFISKAWTFFSKWMEWHAFNPKTYVLYWSSVIRLLSFPLFTHPFRYSFVEISLPWFLAIYLLLPIASLAIIWGMLQEKSMIFLTFWLSFLLFVSIYHCLSTSKNVSATVCNLFDIFDIFSPLLFYFFSRF